MITVNAEHILRYDPSGMEKLLAGFPAQAEAAVKIGQAAKIPYRASAFRAVVLTGLGGSAIGGDLLRSYLAGDLAVPFIVNRNYGLPKFVDSRTLVLVSSYSGNTEETIASYRDAVKKRAKVLCISSGGTVSAMARKRRDPLITIPGGLPPRASLGYSFFPLLLALAKMGFIRSKTSEIRETISLLKEKAGGYAELESPANLPLQTAYALYGKLPIIYSSTERFDAVNLRWRGQLSENGKVLAYGNVFPELNHNEIVGWEALRELEKNFHVVILRDRNDHPRIRARMEITAAMLGDHAEGVSEVRSEGRSLLARTFSLVQYGDWVSFYLAMLNNIDPTPVKRIDELKAKLAARA